MLKKASTSDITNKPGRLGIKESIFLIYMHIFGLGGKEKASMFSLQSSSREITRIFVDAVRMDVSNQTVILDAAIVPSHPKPSMDLNRTVTAMRVQHIVILMADEAAVPFWTHLLPAFVERSRSWKHKPTCEYKATGASIPLSKEHHKQTMCTCGVGIFPHGYLKNVKEFKALRKYAVRAAIPVIYASPLSPRTPRPWVPKVPQFQNLRYQTLQNQTLRLLQRARIWMRR
jgi:hypothetical protein